MTAAPPAPSPPPPDNFATAYWRRDTNPTPFAGNLEDWFKKRTTEIVRISRELMPDRTNPMTDLEVRNLWVTKIDACKD